MSRKTVEPTAGAQWIVCDKCGAESGKFLLNIGPLYEMPARWSRLKIRTADPLGEDETMEFCGDCTDKLVINFV